MALPFSFLFLPVIAFAAPADVASPLAAEAGVATPDPRKARVTFETPVGFTAVFVVFDDVPVPIGTMSTKAFTIEPGIHTIEARGMRNDREHVYKGRILVRPGEFVLVSLPLADPAVATSDAGASPESQCLLPTRTEDEMKACIATRTPPAQGCGACAVAAPSSSEPSPWALAIVPLALIARRRARAQQPR